MSQQRQNPAKDRISELPDSVLFVILSFLPIKEIVATSVLSRRWNPLWCCLPFLDLNDQSFANFDLFRHAIYSIILSREIHLPLRTFRLICGNTFPCDRYDINRFIYSAVQRGVHHLHLHMGFFISMKLPSCVMNCLSLVSLKLTNLCLDADDLTSGPYFPSLKILHLDGVYFPGRRYVMMLLSGCPVLEDFLAKPLFVFNDNHRYPEILSLPKLLTADISNEDLPITLLHNAYSIRLELKSAFFSSVPWFYNLTHLEVICYNNNIWDWHWDWLVKALRHCPKLQKLIFDKAFLSGDGACDDEWEAPESVPMCVSSLLKSCVLKHFEGTKCELQFAKYILENGKVLNSMTVQSGFPGDDSRMFQVVRELCSYPRASSTCKVECV